MYQRFVLSFVDLKMNSIEFNLKKHKLKLYICSLKLIIFNLNKGICTIKRLDEHYK